MKTNDIIDPSSYDYHHPLSVAMRTVSRHWFLAYSKLMSMTWKWSDRVPFGATDGRTLYLNRNGLNRLCARDNGAGLLAFLLVHEALHGLLGHGWRCATMKDKLTANIAADYIINAMIHQRNLELKRTVFPLIEGIYLDEAISGDKSVEYLYRELTQPQPPSPDQQPQPQDTNDKQDQDDSEEGSGQEGDQDPSEQEGDGSADGTGPGGDGADGDPDGADADGSDGGGSQEAGDGSSPDDGQGAGTGDTDEGDGDGSDLSQFPGTPGSCDTLAPEPGEDDEDMNDAIRKMEEDNDRILIADEIDRRTSGTAGCAGARIGEHRKHTAKLDWCLLLREWLTKNSRRGWDSPFNPAVHSSTGLVCAGRRTRSAGDIVLVLDTSGSIGALTYSKFLAQAQSILDDLKPDRLILLSVSHVVCDAVILEPGDMVPDKLKGGGGTAFQPAFDWVDAYDIDPDVMVYLTDGLSRDRSSLRPVDYPLLWISTYTPVKDYPIGDVIEATDDTAL
jgi:predicted metal-dependent peptidase